MQELLEENGYLVLRSVYAVHRHAQSKGASDRLVVSCNGYGYTNKMGIERDEQLFEIMTWDNIGFQGKIVIREMAGKDDER